MKKFLLILSILLILPMIANAEIVVKSANEPDTPFISCAVTNDCNFPDVSKKAGHYRDSYHTTKSSVIEIDGELYTILEYSNGSKALKKGQYWIK